MKRMTLARLAGGGVQRVHLTAGPNGRAPPRARLGAASRRRRRAVPPRPSDRGHPRAARARRTGPLIVCVSRLVPRKGQDVLIRSMRAVQRRVPEAGLLIVGSGPYEVEAPEPRRARADPIRVLRGRGFRGGSPPVLRGRRRLRDAVPDAHGRARGGGVGERLHRGGRVWTSGRGRRLRGVARGAGARRDRTPRRRLGRGRSGRRRSRPCSRIRRTRGGSGRPAGRGSSGSTRGPGSPSGSPAGSATPPPA